MKKIKNSQPQAKFTGSYKKKGVIYLADLVIFTYMNCHGTVQTESRKSYC